MSGSKNGPNGPKPQNHNDLVKVVSRTAKTGTNSKFKSIIGIFENTDIDDTERKSRLSKINADHLIVIDGENTNESVIQKIPSFKNRLQMWENMDKSGKTSNVSDKTVKTNKSNNMHVTPKIKSTVDIRTDSYSDQDNKFDDNNDNDDPFVIKTRDTHNMQDMNNDADFIRTVSESDTDGSILMPQHLNSSAKNAKTNIVKSDINPALKNKLKPMATPSIKSAGKPIIKSESVEPKDTKTVKSVKSVKIIDPKTNNSDTASTYAATKKKPAKVKSVKIVKPVKPSESVKPAETEQPLNLSNHVKVVKSVKSVKPANPVKSVKPAKLAVPQNKAVQIHSASTSSDSDDDSSSYSFDPFKA